MNNKRSGVRSKSGGGPRGAGAEGRKAGNRANESLAFHGVLGLVQRGSPTPSCVFDSYWRFAFERQQVYFRRIRGHAGPWTTDPIIQQYRFTNAYRAADRVSQYLIRNVIYADPGPLDVNDLVFRVLLFKFFNKIATWQLLTQELGPLSWTSYDFEAYDRVLTQAIDRGERIYSAAYIMPACSAMSGGDSRKHRGHLRLIEHMIEDGFGDRFLSCRGMADAFSLLRAYPMLGDFLAYQYATDLNYGPLTTFTEDEFVVPGPGARDGIRKVFSAPGELDEADIIKWVADRQDEEFARRGLDFQSLWGRPLQLIDCQNVFCEVDKYARVKHPDVAGISGRLRIKQKFETAGTVAAPWFPPKWGLNEKIEASFSAFVHPTESDLFSATIGVPSK